MDNAKQQLLERLKTANNILVTVSRDPSVDQLAALLGLTLMLNKQGKHAAAVFSGEVPSTLEFLQPEDTIEKNTDSLRDFIIALDKSKADKLRYKVENDVVRIFITPYKTSISESDFDFSQGDFNVDLVIGLGVRSQEDIDEAIQAHGRILHDATVASVNVGSDGGNLGSINWMDTGASSLSELVTGMAADLEGLSLDEQISNALLTGIVAQTDRFSNDKTSAQTMSVAAILMAAGANQQLVASKLDTSKVTDDGQTHELVEEETEEASDSDNNENDDTPHNDDGALDIEHDDGSAEADKEQSEAEESSDDSSDRQADTDDSEPTMELPAPDEDAASESEITSGSPLMTEPPVLGGTLTANTQTERLDPSTDPLSMVNEEKPELFEHQANTLPASDAPAGESPTPAEPAPAPEVTAPEPVNEATPSEQPPAGPPAPAPVPAPAWTPPAAPVADDVPAVSPQSDDEETDLDAARDEVMRAINASSDPSTPQPPIESLGAQPIDLNPPAAAPTPSPQPDTTAPEPVPAAQINDPNAPPPVPPPIPFQFGNPPSSK